MKRDGTCVALVANSGWYLYNFRLNLGVALREAGFHVVYVSPADPFTRRIEEAGFEYVEWALHGSSMNPLRELRSVFELRRLLRSARARVVCSYTPKGNLYAGLASLRTTLTVIPNVSGLGRVFSDPGLLAIFVKALYKLAFSRSQHVFFQNEDDRNLFVANRIVAMDRTERVMGSGVDLSRFRQLPLPSVSRPGVTFLMVARMLREKGVFEYADAAREMRRTHPQTQFLLLGPIAENSPGAPSEDDIRRWQSDGVLTYLGSVDDVSPILAQADCLVLPSFYREGVPRSLLEGAASGRPCITTDLPGCCDVIEPGVSGLFCRPRDAESLRQQMQAVVEMRPDQRTAMGNAARRRTEQIFSESRVIERYLEQLAIAC